MRRSILYLILIIAFSEPFGDSILLSYGITFEAGDIIVKNIITSLFFVLILSSIPSSFPRLNSIYLPIYLILLTMTFGLVNGLLFNIHINALNDFTSILPILLVFFIKEYVYKFDFLKLSKFVIIVLMIKYLLYQTITLSVFGIPSWKVLMKQSPVLLVCFSLLLGRGLNEKYKKNKEIYIYLFFCFFLILVAQARMLIISSIFILIINILLSNRKNIIIYLIPFFVIVFFLFLKTQGLTFENTLEHYSGDLFEKGLDYRNVQFDELKNRIFESPFFGKGLGYFNPSYLEYSQFAKPYQLELDLLNFISKIGIPFSFVYLFVYFLIGHILYSKKKLNLNNDLIYFFIGILSLLIYSLGQTFHQGYLFWFILFIFYINFIKESPKLKFSYA